MSRNYGETKELEQELEGVQSHGAKPPKYSGQIRHFGDGSHDYARQSALRITTSHDDSPSRYVNHGGLMSMPYEASSLLS